LWRQRRDPVEQSLGIGVGRILGNSGEHVEAALLTIAHCPRCIIRGGNRLPGVSRFVGAAVDRADRGERREADDHQGRETRDNAMAAEQLCRAAPVKGAMGHEHDAWPSRLVRQSIAY
jgi:hypothetical protein